MENVVKLNEAFHSFTKASKSLETYYTKLNERVVYLTHELEKKNTQLNQAIADVRESKDYLQAILQSIGEAIIVTDQNDKISMINKAAEDLLSVNDSTVVDTNLKELDFSIENGDSGTRLKVGGNRFDIILSRSTVRDSHGAISGYVVLMKDITRLKALERQQERNQRLVAMGEMAAKIVHEIRSPLCSIELFSNMLSKDLEGSQHSDMAVGISTGIKNLNNILTNMLFFAKSQKPTRGHINLAQALEESIAMLLPLIETREIKVSKAINDQVIDGDSELLKQVFMNILMNAIQAMPEGGNLDIALDVNREHVTIKVADEGEGISAANVEKIFDPFFSTKDKGTGLGLAIAHKIMQCHNGFISVFRNNGKGSTFCLNFPNTKHEST